jgi:hypothetical protein
MGSGGFVDAECPKNRLIRSKSNETRCGRNVGKTKADGAPVKREQEALDDLNNHSDTPTNFVPYDR